MIRCCPICATVTAEPYCPVCRTVKIISRTHTLPELKAQIETMRAGAGLVFKAIKALETAQGGV